MLQQFFMLQGLQHIQDDENEGTGAGHRDDLPTTTLAILSTFDDTGQI